MFFLLRIEGIPLITRFKTSTQYKKHYNSKSIEGIPLITRFKTCIGILKT